MHRSPSVRVCSEQWSGRWLMPREHGGKTHIYNAFFRYNIRHEKLVISVIFIFISNILGFPRAWTWRARRSVTHACVCTVSWWLISVKSRRFKSLRRSCRTCSHTLSTTCARTTGIRCLLLSFLIDSYPTPSSLLCTCGPSFPPSQSSQLTSSRLNLSSFSITSIALFTAMAVQAQAHKHDLKKF